jgi:hypothetical protein
LQQDLQNNFAKTISTDQNPMLDICLRQYST